MAIMTTSEKYQELLKDQIKQASEWLMENQEEIVGKIKGISDFQIIINLKNGDTIPSITVIQENVFYSHGER